MSLVIGEIMATFPNMSKEFILWKMTLEEVFLWYDVAMHRNYGTDLPELETNITAEEVHAELDEAEKMLNVNNGR